MCHEKKQSFKVNELDIKDIKWIFCRYLWPEFDDRFLNTVKLGYNELGYNEHPVITNTRL